MTALSSVPKPQLSGECFPSDGYNNLSGGGGCWVLAAAPTGYQFQDYPEFWREAGTKSNEML